MKQNFKHQQGFTLVEMSIVLVIIGLLIGGILVGQDLINNARVGATVSQIQKYDTAYNVFRGKYNGIPGDLSSAAAYLTGTAAYVTTARAGVGDGDGIIEDADDTISAFGGETAWAFDHLSAAGMVDGTYTGGAFSSASNPATKLNKAFIGLIANGNSQNVWLVGTTTGIGSAAASGISAAEALGIDAKLDDGAATTGTVIVPAAYTTVAYETAVSTSLSGCVVLTTLDYELTSEDNDCWLAINVSG